jgi:hypothetical protein
MMVIHQAEERVLVTAEDAVTASTNKTLLLFTTYFIMILHERQEPRSFVNNDSICLFYYN